MTRPFLSLSFSHFAARGSEELEELEVNKEKEEEEEKEEEVLGRASLNQLSVNAHVDVSTHWRDGWPRLCMSHSLGAWWENGRFF